MGPAASCVGKGGGVIWQKFPQVDGLEVSGKEFLQASPPLGQFHHQPAEALFLDVSTVCHDPQTGV